MSERKVVVVTIDRIIEEAKPYTPEGKNYTIRQWSCVGTVSGEKKQFVIKTFKKEAALLVANGASLTCEEDNWKGKTTYGVIGKNEGQSQSGRPAQAPQGRGDDYQKGMAVGHAINNAVAIVVGRGPEKVNESIIDGTILREVEFLAWDIMSLSDRMKASEPPKIEDPFAGGYSQPE